MPRKKSSALISNTEVRLVDTLSVSDTFKEACAKCFMSTATGYKHINK